MYYVQRFLAQMVDVMLIVIAGALIFHNSVNAPIARRGKGWVSDFSPMFPAAAGFGLVFSFSRDEEEPADPDSEAGAYENAIRLLGFSWDSGFVDFTFRYQKKWGLILLYAFYYTFCTAFKGHTPGKHLLGLKVVDQFGRKLSYGRAFARWLCYFPSGFPLYLGIVWIFGDRRNQAWHDKLCKTRVVPLGWDGEY